MESFEKDSFTFFGKNPSSNSSNSNSNSNGIADQNITIEVCDDDTSLKLRNQADVDQMTLLNTQQLGIFDRLVNVKKLTQAEALKLVLGKSYINIRKLMHQKHQLLTNYGRAHKRCNSSTPQSSSESTEQYICLAILSIKKTAIIFNQDNLCKIYDAIIKVCVDQITNPIYPELIKSEFQMGWLKFFCKNESTATWMRENFSMIRDISNLDINLIEEEAFPITTIVAGFFPSSQKFENAKIFNMIKAQNYGTNTDEWTVLKRKNLVNSAFLLISIDNDSLKSLQQVLGKIYYGFCLVQLANTFNQFEKGNLIQNEEKLK